jgi:alcohol dehydrogenase
MKAAIFRKFQGEITIEQLTDPDLRPGGAIIKVLATGLCRSDWHGWMGHDPDIQLPHVPGHELAGEIVALDKKIKHFSIGDRVTVPFVCGCGKCIYCKEGNQQVCNHQSQPGFTHWGSFAEYVHIDYADANLVKIPKAINNETAAVLGCRFVTSFRALVHQGQITNNQYIAIHGCGGIGLSAVMIAQAFGAKIIAIDINNENLQLASNLGASHVINARETEDIIQEIHDLSKGGVHISIDALGSDITALNSIQSLRKRGKHIQIGLMTGKHKSIQVPMDKVLANELEIIGSHGMQAHKYPEMLEMIVDGRMDPSLLIAKTIGLNKVPEAIRGMNKFSHMGVTIINQF